MVEQTTTDRVGAAISPALRARMRAIQASNQVRPGDPAAGTSDSEMVRQGLEMLCSAIEARIKGDG